MAYQYGGSEGVWALVWLAIALTVMGWGLTLSIKKELREEESKDEVATFKDHSGFKKDGEGRYTVN